MDIAYGNKLEFIFRHSTKVIFGAGAIRDLVAELDELGARRALLVTDPGIVKAGLAEKVQTAMRDRCAGVFSDVPADSSVASIRNGALAARGARADSVVMLGGGSPIDTGKCIAVLLKSGGEDIREQLSFNQLRAPVAPMIAIPTTAGTGSEVSYGAVVKDAEHNVKMVFGDLYLAPNTAILDPKMTEGLSPRLTAATGLDALTHDIEAFTATQAQPFTDAVALHSMKLIRKYLPRCVEKGDDLEARGQMQIAASMGAIAFNNALLGLTHAMAHALGARYGVHHGTANALFLPHVMLFNLGAVPERFAAIAEALGEDMRGLSVSEASKAAAQAVWRLTRQLGLPQRLRDLSVDQDSLAAMAEVAITDACLLTNPRPVTDPAEILSVYKEAW